MNEDTIRDIYSVSYTHLDVYKRQILIFLLQPISLGGNTDQPWLKAVMGLFPSEGLSEPPSLRVPVLRGCDWTEVSL